jgi:hypothetical protein
MTGESSRADSERLSIRARAAAAAVTKKKAVLGGTAAVLVVAAVCAGGMRTSVLPVDVRHEREERIEAMSARERKQLRQNFAAFERCSPEEQQRLRTLDHEITADANRDELMAVIERYDVWLSEFSGADRNQLKDMPIDARINEIARRKVKDYRLPREDVIAVAIWLKRNAEARYRDEDPQRWEQTLPVVRSLRAVGQMISHFERSASRDMPEDDKLAELIDELSAASQQQLTIAGDTGEKRRALVHWLRQSDLQRELHREIAREITREDLEAHISRLGDDEQRRWRREWQRDPDYVRQMILIMRGMDIRGPGDRRGPGARRGPRPGPGQRPGQGFPPGGPGGPDPPRHRDGSDGLGRPDDGRPRRPGDGRPAGPPPDDDEPPPSGI